MTSWMFSPFNPACTCSSLFFLSKAAKLSLVATQVSRTVADGDKPQIRGTVGYGRAFQMSVSPERSPDEIRLHCLIGTAFPEGKKGHGAASCGVDWRWGWGRGQRERERLAETEAGVNDALLVLRQHDSYTHFHEVMAETPFIISPDLYKRLVVEQRRSYHCSFS